LANTATSALFLLHGKSPQVTILDQHYRFCTMCGHLPSAARSINFSFFVRLEIQTESLYIRNMADCVGLCCGLWVCFAVGCGFVVLWAVGLLCCGLWVCYAVGCGFIVLWAVGLLCCGLWVCCAVGCGLCRTPTVLHSPHCVARRTHAHRCLPPLN
jgi:hypothetical protein